MPLKPKSSRTTCVNSVECGFAASARAAKSATATRGFSTPRPVPVLNQSCASAGDRLTAHEKNTITLKRSRRKDTTILHGTETRRLGQGMAHSSCHTQVEVESHCDVRLPVI